MCLLSIKLVKEQNINLITIYILMKSKHIVSADFKKIMYSLKSFCLFNILNKGGHHRTKYNQFCVFYRFCSFFGFISVLYNRNSVDLIQSFNLFSICPYNLICY